MSVGRLSKWIEKDTIEDEDRKKQEEEDDRQMAKQTHEGGEREKIKIL